jgi:hypothetical protein
MSIDLLARQNAERIPLSGARWTSAGARAPRHCAIPRFAPESGAPVYLPLEDGNQAALSDFSGSALGATGLSRVRIDPDQCGAP